MPAQPPPFPPIQPLTSTTTAGRPDTVKQAAGLLLAAIGLSVLGIFYNFATTNVSRLLAVPTFLLTPVLLVLWLLFTVFTLQGKNWARIGVAILTVWSSMIILTTILILSRGLSNFSVLALPWIVFLLRLMSCYLLFTPQSNAWFRSRPSS